ncbi:MAG TPA: G-D-S-L family lipolytic protein [Cyanobacteria bacterium UBA11149]|nr:G-D-S-L family lipolytic protein [Cyanobacteria bacterium UBA11367]HBE60187.1 G-D-S-L family lipolytic protein [Cyanobacteria bacterium UBA11366]HBK64067.1 G-D-S-L family lipolytic protein [Cyanobacteria bacterium UBA11166]HBR75562.1 G-D-S-L family lipolytic protein [Cyanobacteria bacterium UBA11159]HBS72409.1 G-D-S-L family lipolytic protein [Cyanobacteria bacterium UBA11153]HBW89850.1 G-D-S-L family lipolytic protein [Cyanobacteria bacterium UBA11149]HCA94432.1 G-D-S-L family lipolytic p
MDYKTKAVVLVSLSFNLIFIGLFSLLIIRRGGLSYINRQIDSLIRDRGNWGRMLQENTTMSPYHEMRELQFAVLPKSNRDIIFVGDSLTDEGEWAEWLGNVYVKNRGISGDTTNGVINRIGKIVERKPQQIFLMVGTNDIWNQDKSVSDVVANYRIILEILKRQTPTTQVFVQSLLPVNNQEYHVRMDNRDIMAVNRQLVELSKEFGYIYIDLYGKLVNGQNQLDPQYTLDGVHLNGAGYLTWKSVIESYINP